ncbi:MAG: glutathione S-transferase family protein [Pseudomonadales bacterium]|jgi:glutathione S-transferase|nr:glutathione S-transferase family protein [Pseudomonadales bacterium]
MQATLVIGNKNYSSWSLRPWLLLRHFGIVFEELRIPLNLSETPPLLRELSPTGKAPVLLHDGRTIWESLAICEYVNEVFLDVQGWPAGTGARAHARSLACEMHAGFSNLRGQWPMNLRRRGPMPINAALGQDLARIEIIWNECMETYGGPWLFGGFSIADAMFAPLALRLYCCQPPLSEASAGYVLKILEHPAIMDWLAAARLETEVLQESEAAYRLAEPGNC